MSTRPFYKVWRYEADHVFSELPNETKWRKSIKGQDDYPRTIIVQGIRYMWNDQAGWVTYDEYCWIK